MIPALEDGVLPEGVHDCTFEEIESVFGRFQRTDRRINLTAKLKSLLQDIRGSGLVAWVIVDGSYVTALDEPSDIDLILVLKPDLQWEKLRPFEYNAVSKRMIGRTYRFDAFVYPESSPRYAEILNYFKGVNPDKHRELTKRVQKGILRVTP